MERVKRAPSLAREERRRALKEAVLPLVLEYGVQVSTRQIAEAAGVAEGTIFRVFPTKRELINEVVLDAISPDVLIQEIQALPDGQSMVTRIQSILALMVQRVTENNRILPLLDLPHTTTGGPRCPGRAMRDGRHLITAAVAESLAPYADGLRIPPRSAAASLQAFAFATVNLASVGSPGLEPDEMTSLILYGIAAKERP